MALHIVQVHSLSGRALFDGSTDDVGFQDAVAKAADGLDVGARNVRGLVIHAFLPPREAHDTAQQAGLGVPRLAA